MSPKLKPVKRVSPMAKAATLPSTVKSVPGKDIRVHPRVANEVSQSVARSPRTPASPKRIRFSVRSCLRRRERGAPMAQRMAISLRLRRARVRRRFATLEQAMRRMRATTVPSAATTSGTDNGGGTRASLLESTLIRRGSFP